MSAARKLDLTSLSAASREQFVAALGGVFEHSPWIAEHAYSARPFASVDALHAAMVAAVAAAAHDAQLALIRAHPELAGKAMVAKALTSESTNEQSKAGLTNCTPEATTRPSSGLTTVVSMGEAAGLELKS